MRIRIARRAARGMTGAVALLLAGMAQAALQDRDLNGDTVVDAFYDTDLNITWLRDANVNGAMGWDAAVSWAADFSFGGYTDWRLPTSDTCFGYNCTASEMGHLWYVELGNSAGAMTIWRNFQNLKDRVYLSGTEYAPIAGYVWNFNNSVGNQGPWNKSDGGYAMAVRDGDVVAVPEPETYALMLAGLATLAVARRRRSC